MTYVLQTDVSVDYRSRPGVLRHVTIQVREGETVGLVGQSGSGKTTFVMALLGLLDEREATSRGSVVVNGMDLRKMRERDLRQVRGRMISLIPQNPAAALTPTLSIGGQFREAWLAHAKNWTGKGLPITRRLLMACGLDADDNFLRRYPDQISLGQAQRVLISMALLHNPVLLVADEPTSALDLVTQREVLDLLAAISAERQMSILFISHDLQAVASLCNTLAILHDGTIVECGPTADVLSSPQHAYTKVLLAALPRPQSYEIRRGYETKI
jgi:ABC-type dipeptide/oligopeptide/nickel transport system ATPase component